MNLQPQDTIETLIFRCLTMELPVRAVILPAQNQVLFLGTPFECDIFYKGAKTFSDDQDICIVELTITR